MPEVFIDLLLPATDGGVAVQWIVMAIVWTVLIAWSFRWRHEYRVFVIGLAVANLAFFAARTIH